MQLFLSDGAIDIPFLVITIVLLTIGIVIMYSAGYPYAYIKYDNSLYFFKRQAFFAVLGICGMLVISKINYTRLKYIAAVGGFFISIALLLFVFNFPDENGICRWVEIGALRFQPSEIAKMGLILICACVLSEQHSLVVSKKPLKFEWCRKINAFARMPLMNESLQPIMICGVCTLIFTGLVVLESHLSGTILMALIGVIMLALGGVRKKWFVFGFIFLVIAVLILYNFTDFFRGYMLERVESWLDKDADPLGARWQTNQALYAIGSGGLFGTGLGGSKQKHMYVSEPQNDMIFSILCEETGVIGAGVVIVLFCLLIWRGVVIGINARDRYGMLLSMGIVFQLATQVFFNICVATDTLPNTGISLPFFSYGGTSLVLFLCEMGLILSVSRQSSLRRKQADSQTEAKGEKE